MSGRRSVAPTFAGLPLSGQQSLVHGAAGSIVGSGVGTEVATGAERAAAVGSGAAVPRARGTSDVLVGAQPVTRRMVAVRATTHRGPDRT